MDTLSKIIDPKLQQQIALTIMDELVQHVGKEAFEESPLTFLGATLDCQIQIFYEMHKNFNPVGLAIAKENLLNSALGR